MLVHLSIKIIRHKEICGSFTHFSHHACRISGNIQAIEIHDFLMIFQYLFHCIVDIDLS